jgi:hypothetical protein
VDSIEYKLCKDQGAGERGQGAGKA